MNKRLLYMYLRLSKGTLSVSVNFATVKMQNELFYFDRESRKKVLKMFNRTEEEALEDVATIREWMKTQPHLPEVMEDARISNFLVENKFSVEKTKQKVDMYYTVRSLMSDFFEDSNPKSPVLNEYFENNYYCALPKTTDDFYRPFFLAPKQPNTFDPRLLVLVAVNAAEVRMIEDCTVGEFFIVDMRNITMNDLKKVTPMLALKILTIYKIYSLRIKAAHFIYSPSYISMLATILKSLLKPKLFARIHFHEDATILNEIFKKEDLPKDYGGDGPSLDELQEMLTKKIGQYQDRFDLLDTMQVNEDLRPTKLNNDELLGYYGNFKKLNVD